MTEQEAYKRIYEIGELQRLINRIEQLRTAKLRINQNEAVVLNMNSQLFAGNRVQLEFGRDSAFYPVIEAYVATELERTLNYLKEME
jgi:hypothetical protein